MTQEEREPDELDLRAMLPESVRRILDRMTKTMPTTDLTTAERAILSRLELEWECEEIAEESER